VAYLRVWRARRDVGQQEPLHPVRRRHCRRPQAVAAPWKELSIPMDPRDLDDLAGPSDVELAAIELEWPLIAAELDLIHAEIRVLTAAGGPSELDWRRLRRAEHRRLRALVELLELTGIALGRFCDYGLAVA